jgi:hypothetical protein
MTTLAPEHRRALTSQTIDGNGPGAILRDFEPGLTREVPVHLLVARVYVSHQVDGSSRLT